MNVSAAEPAKYEVPEGLNLCITTVSHAIGRSNCLWSSENGVNCRAFELATSFWRICAVCQAALRAESAPVTLNIETTYQETEKGTFTLCTLSKSTMQQQ